MGRETPRLFTEPLRRLTRHTSLGFEAAEFAETVLGIELLPWQRWLLIHGLELDGNGDPRFRTIVCLVARQNGKTSLLRIVSLWKMFTGRARLVLGSAQSLDISRESWQGAVELVEGDPVLRAEVDAVRRANGEQELRLTNGARYRITAASRSAGRGLSVDLLILDELREHRDWLAWGALSKTVMARPNAQIWALSNAGDDSSVVLNQLRERALAGTDPSIGLFEWSAEDGAALDDVEAWRAANPGLGRTISEQAIRSALATDPPATFRVEVLCQRVDVLDSALDATAWRSSKDDQLSLDGHRDNVVLGLDVAPDGQHVTLVAAAEADGRVLVEVVDAWDSTTAARDALGPLLARVSPRALAWYPSGPAAALAPVLRALEGVEIVELKGQAVVEACMGLADLVRAGRVLHPGDPLLTAHVSGSSKMPSGDGWRFTRRGHGHVDAAYALAGAVHCALTLPVERPMSVPAIY